MLLELNHGFCTGCPQEQSWWWWLLTIGYDNGVDDDNGDGVGGGGKVQGNVCCIAPLHHYHCV